MTSSNAKKELAGVAGLVEEDGLPLFLPARYCPLIAGVAQPRIVRPARVIVDVGGVLPRSNRRSCSGSAKRVVIR